MIMGKKRLKLNANRLRWCRIRQLRRITHFPNPVATDIVSGGPWAGLKRASICRQGDALSSGKQFNCDRHLFQENNVWDTRSLDGFVAPVICHL
jgi:hypothetical protein